MNNTKFFIVLVLILAAAGAVAEIFYAFTGNKSSSNSGITADTIQILPEHLDIEKLDAFTERAEKYLLLTAKQFEEGVDPSTVTPTITPSVSPTPTL